jgi:hypothetical protein
MPRRQCTVLVSFPGTEDHAFGALRTVHLHHQGDLSAIREGETPRPCGPRLVDARLEPNAEMCIFNPVAVAGATPGDIGQDQPDTALLRTWDPNRCPRMTFDEDREFELEVSLFMRSPDR